MEIIYELAISFWQWTVVIALILIGFIANSEGLGYFETLSLFDYSQLIPIMTETFSGMDLLFYGIAAYEGYKFSFRTFTEKDLYELGGIKINLLERNPFSGRSINVLRENFHYAKINKKKVFLENAFLDTVDEKLTKYFYLGGVADRDLFDIIEDIYDRNII